MTMPFPDPRFEFDSGPSGISPYGQWIVQVDATGNLAAWHRVQERTSAYGPFALSAPQSGALWEAIDALDLSNLPSSTRAPVPDEGTYTLTLQYEKEFDTAHILYNDARRDPRMQTLLAALTQVIAQTTGIRPVLG